MWTRVERAKATVRERDDLEPIRGSFVERYPMQGDEAWSTFHRNVDCVRRAIRPFGSVKDRLSAHHGGGVDVTDDLQQI